MKARIGKTEVWNRAYAKGRADPKAKNPYHRPEYRRAFDAGQKKTRDDAAAAKIARTR